MTKVAHAAGQALPALTTWAERWEAPDRGLLVSWARGVEKSKETPTLSEAALRGELPPLAWKGGGDKAIKAGKRIGSLYYLAMWQELRGDPLDIETDSPLTLTCGRFQTQVTFTQDVQKLGVATAEED